MSTSLDNERLALVRSNTMNTPMIKRTHIDLKNLVVDVHVVLHIGVTLKERYINKVIINNNDIPPTYVEIPVVGNLNK